jgi:hypothetical protein
MTKRNLGLALLIFSTALAVGCGVDSSKKRSSGGSAAAAVTTNTAPVTTNTVNQTVQTGTSGNDVLTGTAQADILDGADGDDTINALEGDDLLIGGAGSDMLDGGDGEDTASYAGSALAVTVDLNTGIGTGGDAAGDTLNFVENLIGSDQDDTLTGADAVANVIEGGAGADSIDGGLASQNMVSYASSAGAVTIDLNLGVQGGSGDEAGDLLLNIHGIRGSSGDDTLTGIQPGAAGIDRAILEGGPGADTFSVGNLVGGSVSYEHSPASVIVELPRAGLLTGAASGGDATGDDVSNNDLDGIIGSAFADVLTGSDNFGSVILGGDGDDTITGLTTLQFSNVLFGQGGADTIVGGDGQDLIQYDPQDLSYDFGLATAVTGFDDLLLTDQSLTLGGAGPVITNLDRIAVPETSAAAPITVTMNVADMIAVTTGPAAQSVLYVDANPDPNGVSDAIIAGTGWIPRVGGPFADPVNAQSGRLYNVWDGTGGAVLWVNANIANTAGLR